VTYSPHSPPAVRGGLVLLDLAARRVVRAVAFQYNPESLRRTLARPPDGDGATELIELELVLDAADWLSAGDPQAAAGIAPTLAALESVAFAPRALARKPLTMLVWGPARVWPVRVVELAVSEEAFDRELRPIRATVAVVLELVRPDEDEEGHAHARVAQKARARLAKPGASPVEALGVDESAFFS
jgi:hypothetical protein